MIWSKAFVQERERFDGADVAHLIRSVGVGLDWGRLLRRFGPHWRVLLSHLVLFGYIYPRERSKVPGHVLDDLLGRLARERQRGDEGAVPGSEEGNGEAGPRVCLGTFLSREQYLVDLNEWGYRDARVGPGGPMTPDDVAQWTAAIEEHKSPQTLGPREG
jgi:hypothetical protein